MLVKLDTPEAVASFLKQWATGTHYAANVPALTNEDYAEFALLFPDDGPPAPPMTDADVDLMYAEYLANGGDPGDADQCDPDAF